MSVAGKKWLFTKYDGARKVWERAFPLYHYTQLQAGDLLKLLAASDLTAAEVMDSIDPESDVNFLSIHREGNTMSCGENPYYTLTVMASE